MKNREPRLQGKVAIVTGGGSHEDQIGTGRATALCLAREGAKVLVADLTAENASRTVEEIRDNTARIPPAIAKPVVCKGPR